MTRQKDAFIDSEGNAFYDRNKASLDKRDWSLDPVCRKISELRLDENCQILEIGCGDGSRLDHIAQGQSYVVHGVEPSANAVAKANERGITAVQATADQLPFGDSKFDVVIFGFCLYLCDDGDLFRIASEADRVLKSSAWVLILDFEARAPTYRPYHHVAGLSARKMDYKSMFLWHPAYTLASHEKFHHGTQQWTDDPDEWVSLACVRKLLER